MSENKTYDIEGARKYMEAQERFYAERPDESRVAMRSLLPYPIEGLCILDAGCGYGKDVEHYLDLGASAFGIDSSEAMIELAMIKGLSNFRAKVAGFDNIPATDGLFDIITSRYALQHQERIDDAYREFHRVLKTGGEMVILVPHPIQQLFAKEDKKYHQKEEITVKIYDELSVVHDFTHTVEEYLSAFMLEHFDLLHFSEQEAASGTHEHEFEGLPDWMLMKWRKKG